MKEPWKRLLWIKQAYPDNYTDPEFIKLITKLRYKGKNAKPSKTFSSVKQVRGDLLNFYAKILNTFFIYITFTFIHIYKIDPIPFTIVMTITVLYLTSRSSDNKRLLNFKSSLVITFAMLTLSPVLKSLSKTTASDSIWTLSFWLTIAYVGSMSSNSKSQTLNVSTNMLLAIVTVLASRLNSTTQVFCFLLICIQLNIILPNFVDLSNPYISSVSNLFVYTFITITLGWSYTLLVFSMAIFYIFILPKLFVYWQTYYRGYESSLSRVWEAQTPILE